MQVKDDEARQIFVERHYLVHYGMFNSITGLYPLDANIPPPPSAVKVSRSPEYCQMFPGTQKSPWLRATSPDNIPENDKIFPF